jgi:hypothetical protein
MAEPTRAELVVPQPGRSGGRMPGLRMDIVELLKSSGKAYTRRTSS